MVCKRLGISQTEYNEQIKNAGDNELPERKGYRMQQDIQVILKKQRQFFEKGVTKEYGFRMQALLRLEKALEEWEDALKQALWEDLHKSASESYMAEIGLTKSELKYMKRHLRLLMNPKYVPAALSQFPAATYTIAEPYGVALIMSPWNYPVLLCLEPLIDAIAAGNCVILKPSAYAPNVSRMLHRMLQSIYPEKYVAVIEGGREVNRELLEQRFDYIFFTGSVSVGRLVLEKAAKHVTPVTLELGGKSPCIVDETADLQLAAKRIVFGKLLNAGQTCVAPDYVVAHAAVKDKLIEELQKELVIALGEQPLQSPELPKIINEKHFQRIKKLYEREKIVTGGYGDAKSLRIAPTILDQVSLDAPVMQEEIFGPVLPVMTYRSREQLQSIIQHYEKPLAFYLFTKNKEMEHWVRRTFSFGGGCINDTIIHLASPYMPFGGVGHSGMGSYHGKWGFETFSHRKSIVKKYARPELPFRYHPYAEWKDEVLRMIL